MRTFVACGRIDGNAEALTTLEEIVDAHRPDALLFAGGLFHGPRDREDAYDAAQRRHGELILLERFLGVLGRVKTFVAMIPGPHDAPLRMFLHAGMNTESQSPGVHLVHAALAGDRDVTISGIAGELTRAEDSGEPVVRCSRTTADYFLRAFLAAEQPAKVLLLGVPPTGVLGGEAGSALVGELIDSYHPKLCVTAGETARRGTDHVAHTLIVNPGRLADGSAALIDWNREADRQVELLNFHVAHSG